MGLTLTYPAGGMLVTGGTGRAGQGIVRELAKAGVPLVFTYTSNSKLAESLAQELQGEGYQVTAQHMDMTDVGSIRAALNRTADECGGIHGIACGAGAAVPFNRIADFTIEEIENFFNIDAIGYFRMIHEVVPIFRAQGGGSITVCSTIATRKVVPFDGISPFSKGSLDALIRQVAWEEGPHGIRCNSVPLGWVIDLTVEQFRQMYPGEPADNPADHEQMTQYVVNYMIKNNRRGRPVSSTEAGYLFAFLASNEASYLTGQSISLDSGVML